VRQGGLHLRGARRRTGLTGPARSAVGPPLEHLDAHPDARKAIEDKVEGSFTVLFSVRADGTVYNVRTVEVIDGVAPLAEMWAETIGQWTFVEPGRDVADIEHRRIYMYSSDDDERKLHPDGN